MLLNMPLSKREIWIDDGPSGPGRLSADDPEVIALAQTVESGSSKLSDLGGTMSLNVHLPKTGVVMRVHQPFVSRDRIMSERRMKERIIRSGLETPEPRRFPGGKDVVRCRQHWAELEKFVPETTRREPTWESYLWMYGSMGQLHKVLANVDRPPNPILSTYGPPGSVRRWTGVTSEAVRGDTNAEEMARWLGKLSRSLDRLWVPSTQLPNQIIHGDIRLANVRTRRSDGRPVFLDFGFSAYRPRIHDLAYTLSWIVLQPDNRGQAESFDWGKVSELIDAYEEGAKVKLLPVELQALPAYTAAVPLYLGAISGYTPEPSRRLLDELPFLKIAEWILQNPEALSH